ncbi:tail fiber assembly protein [Leclercia sp. 119287]|uniref:tail fiber assembly protein n=1 Tax=Leclercia sp. 119287 TaxID=2681308 RepID=UPI0012E289D4|nr:tail fiber assembly protein [Leclercia sp. 119287]QGU14883.1 tail fiber assembly protein [Leclercia sp. 119287]
MNIYKYDPATNAFYPYSLKESYEATGSWPEAGVDVDEQTYSAFLVAPEGKIREANENGYPSWADIPPPSHEEQVAAADAEKQGKIDQANTFINSKQWPGKAAIGRLKGDELARYNEWLDYLDALEAVDVTTAPDIIWPEQPAV